MVWIAMPNDCSRASCLALLPSKGVAQLSPWQIQGLRIRVGAGEERDIVCSNEVAKQNKVLTYLEK